MTGARYDVHDTARWVAEPPKTAADSVPTGMRSPFARDRARVLHSASFRRLAGKTQVLAPEEDDVPRTRLTHSLEVAQIARDIGTHLGCDPDLVDLAGLAHDIGHPPFGHNGEQALNRAGAAAGGFEANAQNLRLLCRLENKVVGPDGPAGLNLTRASLDAVVKYPWTRDADGGKFGVFDQERAVFSWLREGVAAPRARSLECQVMDWADDVAYSVHDVEDALLAGRVEATVFASPSALDEVAEVAVRYLPELSRDELRSRFDELLAVEVVATGLADSQGSGGPRAIKRVTSELTGRFVAGAVVATRQAAGLAPLHRYDTDLVVPLGLRAEVALLKAVAAHYVMNEPERRKLQVRQQELLMELVEAVADRAPGSLDDTLRPEWLAAADDAGRLRVVLDQVSLLTDAQAFARHRRLVLDR